MASDRAALRILNRRSNEANREEAVCTSRMSSSSFSITTHWDYQPRRMLHVFSWFLIRGWHHSSSFTVMSAEGEIIITSSSEYGIPRGGLISSWVSAPGNSATFTSSISILPVRGHTSLWKLQVWPSAAGTVGRQVCLVFEGGGGNRR